jgi:hypothetical protein
MNKSDLIKKSEEHQEAIERELTELAHEGKRLAKTAAYVAGGVLGAYFVIRLLTRKKIELPENSDQAYFKAPAMQQSSGLWGGIGKILLTEATMIGLQLAKDRIKDILKDEPTDESAE